MDLLDMLGLKKEDLAQYATHLKTVSTTIEDIKLLLADILEEKKKTNYYLHRQEQRS